MTASECTAWVMTEAERPFSRRVSAVPEAGPGEAVIRVAGCGVCHTDLSFLYHGVKTRAPLPLVLGHEISGWVEAVGPEVDAGLVEQPVVVPAVLPCGQCELCREGHRTICRRQVMPGNDRDGGYASHVAVPARFLCRVPPAVLASHELWELAVVSDAVSTPFQAVRRAGVAPGDLAVVVGSGGIGVHAVQVAAAAGARVIALDVDDRKLAQAATAGAGATLNVTDRAAKDVRKWVRAEAERLGARPHLWKILETSGTRAGQETAFGLLGHGATLCVVGFTMDRLELCLSNLMAYDAVARGNWGADPLLYPELLQWLADGRLAVKPFVERHPLRAINDVFDRVHQGKLARRAVLVPE